MVEWSMFFHTSVICVHLLSYLCHLCLRDLLVCPPHSLPSSFCGPRKHTHARARAHSAHTHTHKLYAQLAPPLHCIIYIYIYICKYVCVCVCIVWVLGTRGRE